MLDPGAAIDFVAPGGQFTVLAPAYAASASAAWRLAIPERNRRLLHRWIWAIILVIAGIVVVGGITRLTQSGLSIVKWEPIVGTLPPLNEAQWIERFDQYRQFPEYQQLRPGMTMGEFKQIFFWEYLHRLLARGLGLVFLVPFAVFWFTGRLTRPVAGRALALFGLGMAQGLMGWLMVASGLVDRPSVSHFRLAAHLSLAFTIVAVAVWLARNIAVMPRPDAERIAVPTAITRGLAVVAVLLGTQIVWGAFVAGLDAGYGYNTFPLMGGRLVPPGIFTTQPIVEAALNHPAGVQFGHRVLGTLLLTAAVVLAWRARRADVDPRSRRYAFGLAGGVASQYLLGVLTLLYLVPIPIAVTHQAVALLLLGWTVAWFHHLRDVRAA